MPFSLRFVIENRSGVMVLIDHDTNKVRPATASEVELWNALTKRVAPTRESYIRVNEQDMLHLLMERDSLRKQVKSLQEQFDMKSEEESADEGEPT